MGCGLIGQQAGARPWRSTGSSPSPTATPSARPRAGRRLSRLRVRRPDWQAVVARRDVDVVVVATTNDALAPVTLAARRSRQARPGREARPRATPPSSRPSHRRGASGPGVVVKVGFNHRFHPALPKAQELFDAGALGPLMYIRGRYGHGGRLGNEREWRADPAMPAAANCSTRASHLIDLARWFLGDFAEVTRRTSRRYFWDMPVEDNGFLLLQHRRGPGRLAARELHGVEKPVLASRSSAATASSQIDGLGGSYGVERLTLLPDAAPDGPAGDDDLGVSRARTARGTPSSSELRRRRSAARPAPRPALDDALAALDDRRARSTGRCRR